MGGCARGPCAADRGDREREATVVGASEAAGRRVPPRGGIHDSDGGGEAFGATFRLGPAEAPGRFRRPRSRARPGARACPPACEARELLGARRRVSYPAARGQRRAALWCRHGSPARSRPRRLCGRGPPSGRRLERSARISSPQIDALPARYGIAAICCGSLGGRPPEQWVPPHAPAARFILASTGNVYVADLPRPAREDDPATAPGAYPKARSPPRHSCARAD